MASNHFKAADTGHASESEVRKKRKTAPTENNVATKRPALRARQSTPVPAANWVSMTNFQLRHILSADQSTIIRPGVDTADHSLLNTQTTHTYASSPAERGPALESSPSPPKSSEMAAQRTQKPPGVGSATANNGPTLDEAIAQCEFEIGEILNRITECIIWMTEYRVNPQSGVQDPAILRIYLATFERTDKVKAALEKVERYRSLGGGISQDALWQDFDALHTRIEELGAFLGALQSSMDI